MRLYLILFFLMQGFFFSCQRNSNVMQENGAPNTKINAGGTPVDSLVYEDTFLIATYLTDNVSDDARVIDLDAAILIYPNEDQISEGEKEYGEDFATIADDGSWYQYQCNQLLDSIGIKVIVSNNNFLKLIGFEKTWQLDVKRKGLPLWNLIFFRKDQEPKIVSMAGLTKEQVNEYFRH